METGPSPQIISVDRLHNHIVVTFADGQAGAFSAALLHELLPRADKLPAADDEPEGGEPEGGIDGFPDSF
ncbi:MAG TPA: hypothetical protein VGD64_09530 [Acidisarcina sp.]